MAVKPGTKRRRAARGRVSFGPRGDEALGLMYRLGGVTVSQYVRFFGTGQNNAYRVLSSLSAQNLTESWPIATGGRPKDFHHLSTKHGQRAILAGGYRAGIGRTKEAREQWKLHQVPSAAEHAHDRNEFFLALRDASLDASRDAVGETVGDAAAGAEVPADEMWGEAHPAFPLFGQKREGGNPEHELVHPDGAFVIRWGDLRQRYLVELETRTRSVDVTKKIDAYAARWARLGEEEVKRAKAKGREARPLSFEEMHPMLIVMPTARRAENMCDRMRKLARVGNHGLGRYVKLERRLAQTEVSPGNFVLFGSLHSAADDGPGRPTDGPLGEVWLPLADYPDRLGGSRVSLRTVARLVSTLRRRGRA